MQRIEKPLYHNFAKDKYGIENKRHLRVALVGLGERKFGYIYYINLEGKSMCTALSFKKKDCYFGRNLDLDCSYGEEVCVMPRRYPLSFRKAGDLPEHYAVIGMATVVNGEPLFYDGVNEYGLGMAGLNFPNNATYYPLAEGKDNITPFEFIAWILGKCKSVKEARALLEKINLVNIPYSDTLPLSPLHWIIADKESSIVVETMAGGMKIYDNPVGVLTNNPPFPYHLTNLNNYRNLRVDNGENYFSGKVPLENYCQGLGAVGLPGDVSSPSRFVRMVFNSANSVCEEEENSAVSQFFHLLSSVEMVRGACVTEKGKEDITVYSACVNADKGLYYYTTYDNRQIQCVDMHKVRLDGEKISRFPLALSNGIAYQN